MKAIRRFLVVSVCFSMFLIPVKGDQAAEISVSDSQRLVCSNCSNGYTWCIIEGECGEGHVVATYFKSCEDF